METTQPAVAIERPRCPYCHADIRADEEKTACGACMSWHHAECAQELGGKCGSCQGPLLGAGGEDDAGAPPPSARPARAEAPALAHARAVGKARQAEAQAEGWAQREELAQVGPGPAPWIATGLAVLAMIHAATIHPAGFLLPLVPLAIMWLVVLASLSAFRLKLKSGMRIMTRLEGPYPAAGVACGAMPGLLFVALVAFGEAFHGFPAGMLEAVAWTVVSSGAAVGYVMARTICRFNGLSGERFVLPPLR